MLAITVIICEILPNQRKYQKFNLSVKVKVKKEKKGIEPINCNG